MNDQLIRANKEFKVADDLASSASVAAHKANSVLTEHKSEKERLTNWKSIMSTAPVMAFTVIFVVVSIGEYLVSKEIYREFNEKWPWAIAIVFFVAGLFVSEFIVYKLFGQKRAWKKYELKRDPNNNNKIPPITGTGIVARTPPILPINAKTIANKAAHVIMAGLKAFVIDTAPVTSE